MAAAVGALGLVVLAAGLAGAAYVGRDDTVPIVSTRVASGGAAIVTAPDLLAVWGPTLHLRATGVPTGQLFVGVAHTDDLDSYLTARSHTEVTAYAWPRSASTREVTGGPTVATPATLDWWVAKASGPGGAELAWPMVDGHYSAVVAPVSGRGPVDVDLAVGLELDGLFGTALAVAAGGLGGVAVGVLGIVLTRRRASVVRATAAGPSVEVGS